MKILFLDTKPIRRGAQVFLSDLSEAFQNSGIDVVKVYLYEHEGAGKLALMQQDKVLGGNENHFFEKIPTIHPALLRRLIKTIRKENPDIILLNGSRTLKYGSAAKPWVPTHIRFVYRIIDSPKFWNPNPFKQWYYRKLVLSGMDAAVGVSAASLKDMVELHRFQKPTAVIHRAIRTEKYDTLPDKQTLREQHQLADQKVLLFLGNVSKQKRPDRFVEIIDLVRKSEPNILAWVIGDGPLMDETKAMVEAKGLSDIFTFHGYQQEVGPLIKCSDVLILSSDTEGLPGVVLECGYVEVPTVSGMVGGIAECIENGLTGYIVTEKQPALYADRVLELIRDESLRITMGQQLKKNVTNDFRVEKVLEKYRTFFQSLMKTN
jgi:glycosyltransferase involved in cell wall biosynthesis